MITENDIKEITKMMNWAKSSAKVSEISLSLDNTSVLISTSNVDGSFIEGEGSSVVAAMENYAKMEKNLASTMENFYAQ